MPQEILILSTGGTIEKSYCERDGSLGNRASQLQEHLLQGLRLPTTKVTIQEIMAKDSLDLTDGDREIIVQAIRQYQRKELGLVVLHGTDTVALTLQHLVDSVPPQDYRSPIVFTGAMRPATMVDSDARQNFTEALLLAQVLPPQAYLSFHSQLFVAPWLKKNPDKGTFEATQSQADLKLSQRLQWVEFLASN